MLRRLRGWPSLRAMRTRTAVASPSSLATKAEPAAPASARGRSADRAPRTTREFLARGGRRLLDRSCSLQIHGAEEIPDRKVESEGVHLLAVGEIEAEGSERRANPHADPVTCVDGEIGSPESVALPASTTRREILTIRRSSESPRHLACRVVAATRQSRCRALRRGLSNA